MPRTSKEIVEDSQKLKKLIPSYVDTPQVFASAKHAEKHGDKKALVKDRRIGVHLLRLERLLSHEGVESRAWDSAVKELIIERSDISESFWKQQLQILRDNGQGDIAYISENQKNEIAEQLQDAQRTGLESWRTYLEQTGDQYPLWFKLYAWEGVSGLGVFDQQRHRFRKRSKDTVAPYPQLNPAVLAGVYDMVAESEKTEPFNTLYSRLLVEQKASIPTPENPEDVHGEWREYTSNDIEAITAAAQATPWCIAGKHYAESYTQNGGKFILFHLQDRETGVYSPTACASIRLDGRGEVVELSGLKGGSSQYLEDGLIPTAQERVKGLPGGERYLQAFEDRQKLIVMDRKFQAGEPFTLEEIKFLYEVDQPIRYLDTYAHDPRPEQFRRNHGQHIEQLAEVCGSTANAAYMIDPIRPGEYHAERMIESSLRAGVDPTFLAHHLAPRLLLENSEILLEADAQIDGSELAAQLSKMEKIVYFAQLQRLGAGLEVAALADEFSHEEKITAFTQLQAAGLELTADELASQFDDNERLQHLGALRKIGATFNPDELVIKVYGGEPNTLNTGHQLRDWLANDVSPSLMLKMLKLNQYSKTGEMHDGLGYRELQDIVKAVPRSGIDQAEFIDQMGQKLADNRATYLGTGDVDFGYLAVGFDVDIVATKSRIDDRNLAAFMERGVDRKVLLDAMVVRGAGGYIDTYTISKSIKKLLRYGCGIDDIATHIEPRYQFDAFDELQEYGANLNINEVVVAMKPSDVISRIAVIREQGVKIDINDILRNAKEGDVYEYMVPDVVAAGADPQLVAEKISAHRYVSEYGKVDDYEWRYLEILKDKVPEVYEAFRERLDGAIQRGRIAREEAYQRARGRE